MCEFCKIEDHEDGYMFGKLLDEHTIDMGAFSNLRVQTNAVGYPNERKLLIDIDVPEAYDRPIASINIPIKYCPICGRKLN